MSNRNATDHLLVIGTPSVIESISHVRPHAVILEDDGDTGYLYALTVLDDGGMRILDAVPIYVVGTSTRGSRCIVRLSWSTTGTKALLSLDDIAHAAFDFSAREGCSRLQQNWNDRLVSDFD